MPVRGRIKDATPHCDSFVPKVVFVDNYKAFYS